jgi:hypothetical protein
MRTPKAPSVRWIVVIASLISACGSSSGYDDLFAASHPDAGGGVAGSGGSKASQMPERSTSDGGARSTPEPAEEAGTGGAGGATRDGGIMVAANPPPQPGAPAPSEGRCSLGVTVARGTDPAIVDFELKPGHNGLDAFAVDGRGGRWWESHDATPGAAVALKWAAGAGETARALRYQGSGLDDWGALTGITVAPCYDASAYGGISFWIQGSASAGTDRVKIELHTPATEPEATGGACKIGEAICDDHFTAPTLIPLSKTWTHYTFTWSEFRQMGWGTEAPGEYRPEKRILSITFSPVYEEDVDQPKKGKGFDFDLDEVAFLMASP